MTFSIEVKENSLGKDDRKGNPNAALDYSWNMQLLIKQSPLFQETTDVFNQGP